MKIGFVGCGNMGSAIIGGIIKSGISKGENILVYDKDMNKINVLGGLYGVKSASGNCEVAGAVDILFLCIKPINLFDVINEIKNDVKDSAVVVSIVAAKKISDIESAFGRDVSVVRVMPNTPALVGEGMSALSLNDIAKHNDNTGFVKKVFDSIGKSAEVTETMMDAVTAVSGSSPAYVFMMIEAMADAAVRGGMMRNDAYVFAAQAVYGSAKMVLETGKHPGELKDMVCSPGGTTIDAVNVLEEKGFRAAIMDAMEACIKKSSSM